MNEHIHITIEDGMYLSIRRPLRKQREDRPRSLIDNITPASKRRLLSQFAKHQWSHKEDSSWRYAGIGYDIVTYQTFSTYPLIRADDEIDLAVWMAYEWDIVLSN